MTLSVSEIVENSIPVYINMWSSSTKQAVNGSETLLCLIVSEIVKLTKISLEGARSLIFANAAFHRAVNWRSLANTAPLMALQHLRDGITLQFDTETQRSIKASSNGVANLGLES